MLDYDHEAPDYDATRGGEERAEAAATAIRTLLPPNARTVVDVACGTAIVSTRLRGPGRVVVGVDQSAGMLALAVSRLDRRVARGDATRLPFRDGSVDAVTFVWLLHLIDEATSDAAIAEAARVLRPGGVLITTVEKNFASYTVPSAVSAILEPVHRALLPVPTDAHDRVVALGAEHGLRPAGETGFVGLGQGKTPAVWRGIIDTFGWFRKAEPGVQDDLVRRLSALPDQDTPTPDPVYRLLALARN